MKSFFYRRRFIFIPLAVIAFLSFISFVVMNLWNYLLPEILHVGIISFWQAMGIFILCKILFGFGKGGPRMGGGGAWMRNRMEERFKHLSPEEKEKFKEHMQQYGCNWKKRNGHDKSAFDTNLEEFKTGAGTATE